MGVLRRLAAVCGVLRRPAASCGFQADPGITATASYKQFPFIKYVRRSVSGVTVYCRRIVYVPVVIKLTRHQFIIV